MQKPRVGWVGIKNLGRRWPGKFVYLRPRQYTDDQGSPRHRLSIFGCERVASQIRIFRLQLDVTLLHECIDV